MGAPPQGPLGPARWGARPAASYGRQSPGRKGEASTQMLLLDLFQDFLDRRNNPFDDRLDPLGGRMQAVGLVELWVARDAVEEKWIKHSAVGFGQSRIDRVERAVILGAKIGRGAHAGDEGRQMGGLGFVQNRGERRSRRFRLEAAQHIVS